jgi:hypothetical protein
MTKNLLVKHREPKFWRRENPDVCYMFPTKFFNQTYVNLCKSCRLMSLLQLSYLYFWHTVQVFGETRGQKGVAPTGPNAETSRRPHGRCKAWATPLALDPRRPPLSKVPRAHTAPDPLPLHIVARSCPAPYATQAQRFPWCPSQRLGLGDNIPSTTHKIELSSPPPHAHAYTTTAMDGLLQSSLDCLLS